jgi:uncharacterized LabA/DUF88 family protein
MSSVPSQKTRSIIYIDGFNFYYGVIKDTNHKWLDLQRYFTLLRQADDIQVIRYFTAMVDGSDRTNQEVYIRALTSLPLVRVVLGRFKLKRVKCQVGCGHTGDRLFQIPEEKRTDVNIAVSMVDDAHRNLAERFILVSGDSDLVPAVHLLTKMGKEVLVYIPARDATRGAAAELRTAATRAKTLPCTLLQHSHLPAKVPDGSGGTIDKPTGW